MYIPLILEEIKFYGKKVQVKQAWLAMRGALIRSILKLSDEELQNMPTGYTDEKLGQTRNGAPVRENMVLEQSTTEFLHLWRCCTRLLASLPLERFHP